MFTKKKINGREYQRAVLFLLDVYRVFKIVLGIQENLYL